MLVELVRHLCVCLCVTIVVALQAYGVINVQHRIEHGLQSPGVSYAEASAVDHDHGYDHGHDHEAPLLAVAEIDDSSSAEMVNNPAGDGPINHHHHNGGDGHLALALSPALAHVLPTVSTNQGPGPDLPPPDRPGDAPSHPPKQQRLIA